MLSVNSVRFLDYRKLYTAYQDEIDSAIKRSLITGKLILQDDVEEFERRFAEFLGVKHVVGLNSGTDALMMALIAAGVGPGDEVITVSHTFIATIQVIHHVGATPVLVDVGEDGLMDVNKVREAITEKTQAVIPVHLSGDVVGTNELLYELNKYDRRDHGIIMVEDAAQAIGAKGVGYGLSQCYSFYPAKVLGTFGDAGALATNDGDTAARVKSLRNHGGVTKYDQETYEYGWNSRLDNIWAACLNVKLDYLRIDLKKREEVANRYNDAFADTEMILPVNRPGRIWQDYVVRFESMQRRDEMKKHLDSKGVETLGAGQLPNHRHPGLGLDHFNLPKTDEHVFCSLRLPCNHFLEPEEVSYVIESVKSGL